MKSLSLGDSGSQNKQMLLLGGLLLLVFLLWNTPVILPLKILTVFFHEASHALATVLTGGRVEEMVVVHQQGGHVLSVGGNRFITLSAGYLGSLVWGAAIYMSAAGLKSDRASMAILGGVVIMITFVFVSNVYARGFGLATGVAMLLAARYLGTLSCDFILRLVGLTSMIYAPLDIFSDCMQGSACRSDARMLASEFGGTTFLWGLCWIVVSGLIIAGVARWSLRFPLQRRASSSS